MTGRHVSGLAPEEIMREAAKVLARDQSRLSGLNYPVYRGQTVAPMSTLTQRARGLRQDFASRPAPLSKRLESVLSRPNVGIGPQDIERQLMMLREGQGNFNEGQMLDILRKQFRQAYEPRTEKFRQRGQKDVQRGLGEYSVGLGDIGKASGVLEQSSNAQLVKTLKELQAQKEAQREGLVGTLEQFGAQKHGYTNLANKIARNQFDQEASLPHRRMEMLQEGLRPLVGKTEMGVDPDIQYHAGRQGVQALRAYGIDTNRPVDEWSNARTESPRYKGQLVANLPPEILASHATLEGVNPRFRDSMHGKRRELMDQLMEDRGIGQRAVEAVPERMRGAVESLESEAKQKLKKDLASINSRYIRNNQYGSPQHMKEAEERAREISKATLGERNKLLQDAMKSELSLGHQGQLAKLQQLGLYGAHGQKEFGDVLGNLRNLNKLGSTKWANEQAENEELYRNYQNEAAWEWPHLKSVLGQQARAGALGDIFRGLEGRDVSLDNVAKLNTNYSELEKERESLRGELGSLRDLLDARNLNYNDLERQRDILKGDFSNSEDIRRNLEQQLARFDPRIAAQQQSQRESQLANSGAELKRLTGLKDEALLRAQGIRGEQTKRQKAQRAAEDEWKRNSPALHQSYLEAPREQRQQHPYILGQQQYEQQRAAFKGEQQEKNLAYQEASKLWEQRMAELKPYQENLKRMTAEQQQQASQQAAWQRADQQSAQQREEQQRIAQQNYLHAQQQAAAAAAHNEQQYKLGVRKDAERQAAEQARQAELAKQYEEQERLSNLWKEQYQNSLRGKKVFGVNGLIGIHQ